MWKTKDGQIFETENLAVKHEKRLNIIEYFDEHRLYGRYEGCDYGGEDIVGFIDEHINAIRFYICDC